MGHSKRRPEDERRHCRLSGFVVGTLCAVGLATAGCNFKGAMVGDVDGDGDAGTDASVGLDGADGCPWGERALFDPCGEDADLFVGENIASAIFVSDAAFDTTTSMFLGSGPAFVHKTVMIRGQMTELWIVDDLTITTGNTLSVGGDFPLIIAATGDVRINGTLDVGSRWRPDGTVGIIGGRYEHGPGANPATANALCASTAGTTDNDGGGGGAGGCFGSVGGDGGLGRANDQREGLPGQAGQAITLQEAGGLRTGCPGSQPGAGDQDTTLPPRAPAGGALLISSLGEVTVSGAISAGGAAGVGQPEPRRGAGGGGGSGGLVVIQAPEFTIGGGGGIFANGGGGGGGADGAQMGQQGEDDLIGVDGRASIAAAIGADGQPGLDPRGFGGNGAALGTPADDGNDAERGAGGGGGGTGHIALVVVGGAILTNNGVSSPRLVEVDVDLNPN